MDGRSTSSSGGDDVRRRLLVSLAVAAAALAAVAPAAVHGRGEAAPTYADVAPIFASKCAGCHMPGGIAPFSLLSPKQAHEHAQLIKIMTHAGAMPPWPPGRDSRPFVGQGSRQLTDREKDLIARWAAGGGKVGARVAPPPPAHAPKGIVFEPRGAYMPHPAVGFDDYHCTLIDPQLRQGKMVTAAHVLPGRRDIVHHVILYELRGPSVAAARAMNRANGGNGWTCFGGPGVGDDSNDHGRWLGVWVPGKTNDAFPSGTGMSFPKGAAIVVQIHYNLIHRARPDRTRVSLEFARAGAKLKPLETKQYFAPIELPCPAAVKSPLCKRAAAVVALRKAYGADAAATPDALLQFCRKKLPAAAGPVTTCDRQLDGATTIYAVLGHMHVRGVDIRVELNPGHPGATLLHIPAWNFHWQDFYTLEKPVRAPAGSIIRVTCRYDNSPAKQPIIGGKALTPRYVLWGEGTTDEMCLGVLQTGVTRQR
jgi:mono/diheme cytochrome c family protein